MLTDAGKYLIQLSGNLYRLKLFSVILLLVFILTGCFGTGPENEAEYLIRIGERVVTEAEFNKAFELAKTAYGHNAMINPEAAGIVKTRLMNQMIEELLLMEIAGDHNIKVSDAELDKAISDIKADYPGNTFEQVLLENAISFSLWKKRLKRRLLMEKVVNIQLKEKIEITSDDIAGYYNKHYNGDEKKTGAGKDIEQDGGNPALKEKNDINETIVKQLRRGKTEEVYMSWIETLKGKYSIDINLELWKKILG